MVASATYAPYGNLGAYMKLGYVPVDQRRRGGLEDGRVCLRRLDHCADGEGDGQRCGRRDLPEAAGYWRNNFNVADGFVEPRLADGDYRKPFDPAKAGAESGFTEGNAWQYSWYQPQDEQGLIDLLGGKEKLIAKLDAMFDQKVDPADMRTWKTSPE